MSFVAGLTAAEIARSKGLDSLVITLQQALRLPDQPEESDSDAFAESQPHVWRPCEGNLRREPAPAEGIGRRIRELQNWPGAFVLLDCPPAGAELPAEALAAADGIVVVVAAGETNKSDLSNAARKLNEAKASVIGMILNKRTYAIPKPFSWRT